VGLHQLKRLCRLRALCADPGQVPRYFKLPPRNWLTVINQMPHEPTTRYETKVQRESGYRCESFYIIATLSVLALVLPNFFLFSSDDVFYASLERPFDSLASNQASDGRYGFALAAALFPRLGLSYNAFLAFSAFALVAALVRCSNGTVQAAGVILSTTEGALFFALFASFGLLADVYQFTFAYLSYALAFWCAGQSIEIAFSAYSTRRKILQVVAFGWVAAAFYQLYPSIVLAGMLGIVFLWCGATDRASR
jgi:hypothetical protein